MTEAGRTSQL